MKKQGFLNKFLSLGGILIKGARVPLVTPLGMPMIMRQDRSPNKFFHKKKHLNQN